MNLSSIDESLNRFHFIQENLVSNILCLHEKQTMMKKENHVLPFATEYTLIYTGRHITSIFTNMQLSVLGERPAFA